MKDTIIFALDIMVILAVFMIMFREHGIILTFFNMFVIFTQKCLVKGQKAEASCKLMFHDQMPEVVLHFYLRLIPFSWKNQTEPYNKPVHE